MSDAFYAEMRDMADEMLAEFKQGTVTLSRTVYAAGANEWTSGAATTTTYTLDAVVSAVGDKFVDNTLIFATDRMVTCAVPEIEIQPGDVLSIDGVAVVIVKTMRIPAAGQAVAWKFVVRG